jgi:hypothetical protein
MISSPEPRIDARGVTDAATIARRPAGLPDTVARVAACGEAAGVFSRDRLICLFPAGPGLRAGRRGVRCWSRRFPGPGQAGGGLEREGVDEGLGDVAAQLPLADIEFLGEQPGGPQAARLRSNQPTASACRPCC